MEICKGVRGTFIKNDKFKTNMIGVYFSIPLSEKNVSVNALIPAILRRGCRNYPTMKEISRALEKLYGAKFDCGVSKRGEIQTLRFYGEVINDKLLPQNENLFEQFIKIIKEIIFHPVLENEKFKSDYISQEKEKIKNIINARKNDKVQYALERCYELMYENEPFGLCEYGTVNGIDKVTDEDLMKTYADMVKTYQVDIVISGDFTEEEYLCYISKFHFSDRNNIEMKSLKNDKEPVEKEITEEFDINQGKLSLGYRTGVKPNTEKYFDMLLFNGILGGGVQSKLFQNVREKNSLAYYAFSRFDKFQGSLGISCGIEPENYDKTLKIVKEQVDAIKMGEVSKEEYETTLKTLENAFLSLNDEQYQLLDFYFGQSLINSDLTIQKIIQEIKKVNIEDIIEVAKNVKLDTVYFMKNK